MIRLKKHDNTLLLHYKGSGFYGASWVSSELKEHGKVTIRKMFTFLSADLTDQAEEGESDEREYSFALGVVEGNYYRIARRILGLKHDLFICKQMPLSPKTFIANRDISIFGRIDNLVDEPIVVGGDADGAIPLEAFDELLANFPTSTEITHYANTRVARVLKDYLGTMSDAQAKLDKHLSKKHLVSSMSPIHFLKDYEPRKFQYIRDELQSMLKDSDSYSEHAWQKKIVGFLLLLFPKYIAVLENLQVKDFYSDPIKVKNRYVDLTLVDANGNIDIVEIKKPFDNCILSRNKYRDNYTPQVELSGSVMQSEKYIFHLNKWGRAGENEILEKRKSELPTNFRIRVSNPQAMIILGRDKDFEEEQKFDFEIIKRKFSNVIDIMTYDDLLRRLDNIIVMIHKNYSKLGSTKVPLE